MEKITAIIPTYNEEANIESAIKSVLWADEILVVDSFSNDNTLNLARRYPVKIIQNKFTGYGKQKNFAIQQALHEWIFILDADERVPEKLTAEILKKIENTSKVAFKIPRNSFFMGKRIKYSGWQHDYVTRLFKKEFNRYNDKEVHEEIISDGEIGTLKNKLDHYTYRNLVFYLDKLDHYTTLSAKERIKKISKINLFHLALKPLFRFFKHYFMQLGFLDGKRGFIIASLSAYSVFLRHIKLWRIHNGEHFNDER